MSLTPDQARAAYAEGSVAVTAGAGTGKTHMLAERYVFLLKRFTPLQMVAVTFTEKAAAELKARIRKEVAKQLPERADLLSELEAGPISTLHGLAARICREHPEAAGVRPDFTILDDQDGQVWLLDQEALVLEGMPSHVYDSLGVDLTAELVRTLSKDPLAAEEALAHGDGGWQVLVRQERHAALEGLLAQPEWRKAVQLLRATGGSELDKAEGMRRQALAGVATLEAALGTEDLAALELLTTIDLRGGSEKAWPAGDLKAARAAMGTLRDLARDAEGKGLVTLALGPDDEQLVAMLPAIREAFDFARKKLDEAKQQLKALDFSDLEVHALRALENPEVRAYYGERWKAFMVDEFQDTNPVQAKLLEHLTQGANLTIVGDEKQSIYGFRRADVEVFRRFKERILSEGGEAVTLSKSFRTNGPLIQDLNQIFRPVLGDMHQDLEAAREEAPGEGPCCRTFAIQAEKGINKPERQRSEATELARSIREAIDLGVHVHDKRLGCMRPIQPGDIAILSRTWGPLDTYGEALEAVGLPIAHAGGGNLLATREVMDAMALLRFLQDRTDSLSLAAVLRSPFFAVSDRDLYHFASGLPRDGAWWEELVASSEAAFAHPVKVLALLLERRKTETPSRLLQIADQETGYTAIIRNMSGAKRREADWRGFLAFLLNLEGGGASLLAITRRLERLEQAELEVARPPVEAGNAVALMTIHAAKGLEWPMVIVPDLTRAPVATHTNVRLEAGLGVAVRWEGEEETKTEPCLFKILKQRQARREAEEAKRILYVALTRARDTLILSAADEKGAGLDSLMPGLEAAALLPEPVAFDPVNALLLAPPIPGPLPAPPRYLTGPVGACLAELPVTSLVVFSECPRRFRLHYLEGNPGVPEDEVTIESMHAETGRFARRVGLLTHLALERDIASAAELACHDPTLPLVRVAEALELAGRYLTSPVFAHVRQQEDRRELPLELKVGKLKLVGIADRVGTDYVVDYKTSGHPDPGKYRHQLWAYRKATGLPASYVAFLRQERLIALEPRVLSTVEEEVAAMARAIHVGRFEATPSAEACGLCAHALACDEAGRA